MAELDKRETLLPHAKRHADILFRFTSKKVISTEKRLLRLFNLPTIEEITLYIAGKSEDDLKSYTPKVDESRFMKFEDLNTKMIESIVGEDSFTDDEDSRGEWGRRLFKGYQSHGKFIFDDIVDNAPSWIPRRKKAIVISGPIEDTFMDLLFDDPEFLSILDTGINRISNLSSDDYDDIKKMFIKLIREGGSAYSLGTKLHKHFGGQLWRWRMRVDSEMTLCMNRAFQLQSQTSGINYEVWSAAANACDVCAALDGRMWRLGFGPEPVSDTHPRCACHKYGRFEPGKNKVEPKWNEPSPYKNP